MSTPNLTPQLTFLIEYLDLQEATGDPEASWEVFQIEHLNNRSLLTIDNKARQVGWSWTAAADNVARRCLYKGSTGIFVSINQVEAQEKIRYAKQIIESLDPDVRPKLIIDNRLELELENGSRLISHPCKPVRGKAKADLYLDEFAHYPKDREIYQSAVPVTTRGGSIRIGSTPLGAHGLFWELYSEQLRRYPGYLRRQIPWWSVQALCKDPQTAGQVAPQMLTEERVAAFGTGRLIQIFENLPLEDFQQEYECAWVDEAVAWIDWDLIKKNQVLAQDEALWYRQAKGVDAALDAIDQTAEAVLAGTIEPVLAAGFDVGRKRDLSELVVVGKSTTGQTPCRLSVSLERVRFDDQRAVARRMLDRLPILRLLIDQNGLGMQLAEQLNQEYAVRAEGVNFTGPNKELWAVTLKVQMERGAVPIPLDRDLSHQIHSIKKKVTPSKNAVFDTERNERHHADKFWALALAVSAANQTRADQVHTSAPNVVTSEQLFS